jgi:hypothetical protein
VQARKVSKLSIAVLFALSLTGCSQTDATPDPSVSAAASLPATESSATPNVIEPAAESAYRTALEISATSAEVNGLTELWYDSAEDLVQIVVQDPKSKKFVSYDVTDEALYPIDLSAMMPARLLAELDGLIKGGLDEGSVVTSSSGGFVITNTIDLTKYVTTYLVDDAGRIATAEIIADDEPLGTVTYNFSITAEGKRALAFE